MGRLINNQLSEGQTQRMVSNQTSETWENTGELPEAATTL